MKNTIRVISLCLFLFALSAKICGQESFHQYMDLFARSGMLLHELKNVPDQAKQLQRLYEEVDSIHDANFFQPEIELLKARILYAQEKYSDVIDLAEEVSGKYETVMPDWFILGYYSADAQKREENTFLFKIAQLLPFSSFGQYGDYDKQDWTKNTSMGLGDTVPLGYGFGETDAYYMAQAFQSFHDVQGYSGSILILIYVKPYLDKDQKHLRYDLRLTPSESLWREIGHAERQQGHEHLARIAYLRAAFETPANKQELQDEWNEKVELVANPKSVPREAAENIALLYSRGKYWPWSIDILKRAESFDQERINGQVQQFANEVAAGLRQNPTYVRWGVPATEITDFENFHLAKPAETFWNEETLYGPKESAATE